MTVSPSSGGIQKDGSLCRPDDGLAQVETLVQMMARRAELTPDKTALCFGSSCFTYERLWADICRMAAYLRTGGVGPGDRVVIVMPNCAGFFAAFYGVQAAGAVAVPVFHGSGQDRVATVSRLCGAVGILFNGPLDEDSQLFLAAKSECRDLRFFSALEGETHPEIIAPLHRSLGDLAMLQYTSGTTGDSKGVMLTHGNLLANVRQMILAARYTASDVFVSWLPVYHDMGLINMTMCPFYLSARLVLLPISLKTDRWLGAIARHRGTMTAAPDFAYRFCIKFSKKGARYDLSSLRFALNAAEPVRATTIRRFEEKFNAPGVIKPGYGLAEASVAAAFSNLDEAKITVDQQGNVGAGFALPAMDLAIAKDNHLLGSGEVGEILMRGPSCTTGYYRNRERTKDLHFGQDYIRTGDLGYLDPHGRLFIVGRAKNIIIRAGRNFSPKDFEELAEEVDQVKRAAAIGVDARDLEGEQILVFAEVNHKTLPTEELMAPVARQITAQIKDNMGITPNRIFLVRGKTIPLTYNGKIQYGHLRDRYLSGDLHSEKQILYPQQSTPSR